MELMIEHKVVILKNDFCSLKQKNHPVLVLYLHIFNKLTKLTVLPMAISESINELALQFLILSFSNSSDYNCCVETFRAP